MFFSSEKIFWGWGGRSVFKFLHPTKTDPKPPPQVHRVQLHTEVSGTRRQEFGAIRPTCGPHKPKIAQALSEESGALWTQTARAGVQKNRNLHWHLVQAGGELHLRVVEVWPQKSRCAGAQTPRAHPKEDWDHPRQAPGAGSPEGGGAGIEDPRDAPAESRDGQCSCARHGHQARGNSGGEGCRGPSPTSAAGRELGASPGHPACPGRAEATAGTDGEPAEERRRWVQLRAAAWVRRWLVPAFGPAAGSEPTRGCRALGATPSAAVVTPCEAALGSVLRCVCVPGCYPWVCPGWRSCQCE